MPPAGGSLGGGLGLGIKDLEGLFDGGAVRGHGGQRPVAAGHLPFLLEGEGAVVFLACGDIGRGFRIEHHAVFGGIDDAWRCVWSA